LKGTQVRPAALVKKADESQANGCQAKDDHEEHTQCQPLVSTAAGAGSLLLSYLK